MKLRKTEIYILTALLLAAAVFCWALGSRQPFSFSAGGETIRFWDRGGGERLVFLPGYAGLDDLRLQSDSPVTFGDIQLQTGESCGSLELDRPYALEDGGTITFLQSKNLPALYIDTASGSMDYIHEDKAHSEGGALRLYDADGGLNFRGSLESIAGHGNSTFIGSDKKPYSLKLTADGDLLGMGAAKKWVLLANCYDQSHMKHKLVFDYAAELGLPFSPDSRWVDLYLNGNYAGIYLLSERNEIHPERVAIDRGFLVSKDKEDRMAEQNIPFLLTENRVPLRLHGSTVGQGEMLDILQSAENAIMAEDGIDPVTGRHWTELIDLDSWARKYLIEEIFGGGDAGHYSQYFYWQGGKLFAGPVWDYDITMGIDVIQEIVPNIFYAHREHLSPWFHALYQKEAFYSRVTQLYRDEFYPMLCTYVEEKMPAYQAYLAGAARLNQLRWGADAAWETARMQEYMRGRMAFLWDAWVEGKPYSEVTVIPVGGVWSYSLVYATLQGDRLPDFESWEAFDWYISELNTHFDLNQPIYEDMMIYAKNRTEPQPAPAGTAPEAESHINFELWIPVLTISILFLALFTTDILRLVRSDSKHHAKTH